MIMQVLGCADHSSSLFVECGLSSVMPCLAQRINNSIPGIHNLLPCFTDPEL